MEKQVLEERLDHTKSPRNEQAESNRQKERLRTEERKRKESELRSRGGF